MSVHRAKRPGRDLFAAAAIEAPAERGDASRPQNAPTGQPLPPRHLLPKDLPGSLMRLDDGEIDTLLAAVTDEAKRRGLLPLSSTTTSTAKPAELDRGADSRTGAEARPKPFSQRRSVGDDGVPALTLGRANAVRAAFMAGVKPVSYTHLTLPTNREV